MARQHRDDERDDRREEHRSSRIVEEQVGGRAHDRDAEHGDRKAPLHIQRRGTHGKEHQRKRVDRLPALLEMSNRERAPDRHRANRDRDDEFHREPLEPVARGPYEAVERTHPER